MHSKRKPRNVCSRSIRIPSGNGSLRVLIVEPKSRKENRVGVLWLHGGGYRAGRPELLFQSRGIDLVNEFGAVLVAPDYSLSPRKPYPAALLECHDALVYMKNNAKRLGISTEKIIVGGESAGGGLTAAVCMYAHDQKSVDIAFQMPIYPMLDCYDTESSRNNHAKLWTTKMNHSAWKLYLRGIKGQEIPCYASPSRRKDYSGLPPCYTFVGDIEPFYCETLAYVKALNDAGVKAEVDVYENWYHAYDMANPREEISKKAVERFLGKVKEALGL